MMPGSVVLIARMVLQQYLSLGAILEADLGYNDFCELGHKTF
jgi:hypothetical protein